MCKLNIRQANVCTKDNMIPDSVLQSILEIYEFGNMKDLKRDGKDDLPDLICSYGGNFWTTWTKVIEYRKILQKRRNKIINER